MTRIVCVKRYGYATVSGKTEADILEKTKTLSEEDFDWESVTDFTQEAEIVEEAEEDEAEPYANEDEPQKVMVYTSPRGKTIVFDDWEDETEEYGIFWAEMCPRCRNKFRGILGKRISDDGAVGTCYVQGCWNEATYYAEFNKNEISFQPDTSDNGNKGE